MILTVRVGFFFGGEGGVGVVKQILTQPMEQKFELTYFYNFKVSWRVQIQQHRNEMIIFFKKPRDS